MTALAADRRLRTETWSRRSFKLPTGKTAFKNAVAVYDQSLGKCIPAEAGQTDLFALGHFYEKVVNASGADVDVVVNLKREVKVTWYANDATNPVLVTDIGKPVYMVDDQTASILATARSVLGTAWAVDATLGVAVEMT